MAKAILYGSVVPPGQGHLSTGDMTRQILRNAERRYWSDHDDSHYPVYAFGPGADAIVRHLRQPGRSHWGKDKVVYVWPHKTFAEARQMFNLLVTHERLSCWQVGYDSAQPSSSQVQTVYYESRRDCSEFKHDWAQLDVIEDHLRQQAAGSPNEYYFSAAFPAEEGSMRTSDKNFPGFEFRSRISADYGLLIGGAVPEVKADGATHVWIFRKAQPH